MDPSYHRVSNQPPTDLCEEQSLIESASGEQQHEEEILLSDVSASQISAVARANGEKPTSQNTFDPNPSQNNDSHETVEKRPSYRDSWLWEIGGGTLSLLSMAAIISVLFAIHNKALTQWRFEIQPNTVVSILATVSKTSLMIPVAASMGQLKWLHFQDRPQSLAKLEIFDNASRGPYGSIRLLYKMKFDALIASFGALITVVALAVDPFAQQVIRIAERQVEIEVPAAMFVTQKYDTGIASGGNGALTDLTQMDTAMAGYIMSGIFNITTQPVFNCGGDQCNWQTVNTLGICSSCNDVTSGLQQQCPDGWDREVPSKCSWTTPGNFTLSALFDESDFADQTWYNSSGRFNDENINYGDPEISMTLASFGVITVPSYTQTPWPVPNACECELRWCAQTYENVTVADAQIRGIGKYVESELQWGFSVPGSGYWSMPVPSNRYQTFDLLTLKGNSAGYTGNKTFTINHDSHVITGRYLASVFTIGSGGAISGAMLQSSSIADAFANVAMSMTNGLRLGANYDIQGGTVIGPEVYIAVRWLWLVLPVLVVMLGNILLVVSIIESTRYSTPVWKTSSLALAFHGLLGPLSPVIKSHVATIRDMQKSAEDVEVQLRASELRDLGLVLT